MRFRRREWDVVMPDALVGYWTAWNEPDLERIGGHLAVAVTDDVEWNDPRDSRWLDAMSTRTVGRA
jgi:hypothetical protein